MWNDDGIILTDALLEKAAQTFAERYYDPTSIASRSTDLKDALKAAFKVIAPQIRIATEEEGRTVALGNERELLSAIADSLGGFLVAARAEKEGAK